MAIGDFDTYYGDHPWAAIDKNQRTWYDPELIALFRLRSIFTPTLNFVKNLGDKRATSMVLNQIFDPHPDTTSLAMRQMWMPASYIDSRQIEITFDRYGGKVAYTKYDDIISYWEKDNQAGLRPIIRGALGNHMVDVMDLLARNAYLKGAFLDGGYSEITGGGSDLDDIETTHKFDINSTMDVWLRMSQAGMDLALGPNGAAGNIVCFTTPSVIYDIQKADTNDAWINASNYDSMRYEVGMYKNVRFIQSPKLTMWNAGTLITQKSVTAAISAGDGAPVPGTTKVDGTYMVGQTIAGITNYIQLDADTDLAVNDIITIHTSRTATWGVTNGVDPLDGKSHNRRIISIDTGNHRITLDKPVLMDFTTDLGGGVYAYVTKARHIHASIFVGAPNVIVSGVAIAPQIHNPPTVDDFNMIRRFSWDSYLGHQMYMPEAFEVHFSAGTIRTKGAAAVQ